MEEKKKKDHSVWNTLMSSEKIPKGFWKLTREDLICFLTMFLLTLFIWINTAVTGPFYDIFSYWDGPNYLYVSMTGYKIPLTNPWTKYYHMNPSYFACHLPGYPMLITICSKICLPMKLFGLNNYYLGFHLSILVSSFLYVYGLRRLLIVTKTVRNPLLTTILSVFLPIRFVIYHSVGSSEPLFMFFVFLTFIFYKTDQYIFMLFSIWMCCYTRIEGMAIGASIGICYLLRFCIFKAIGMFLTFLAPITLILLHKYMFNDPLAYIHYNQGSQSLIGKPFHEILNIQRNGDELYSHSFIIFFTIIFIGHLITYTKSIPIGVLSSIYLIYISCLSHIDIYRYALPCSIFSILIGFDCILSTKEGRKMLVIALPFYLIVLSIYARGQIHSNIAVPFFIDEMFNSLK